MSGLSSSSASLRCVGVDPAEVTAALGRPPSKSRTMGEPVVLNGKVMRSAQGGALIATIDIWLYRAALREPQDVDGQIEEICAALTGDLSVWRALGAQGRLELCVGLSMRERNGGMSIASRSLALLAERGVMLDLDIYYEGEPEAQPLAK